MGYELKRFFGEVDEEFHCFICKKVMENPVQTPCEHTFCIDCIKECKTCPVDDIPLTNTDLKQPSRPFRNLLNKLEIECDFRRYKTLILELIGCKTVVKLEDLKVHIDHCAYNPEAEIICNKGCNLKMTRRDFQLNNCFSHLAKELSCKGEEIVQLKQELSQQIENFKRLQEQFTDLNTYVISKLCYKRNIFEMPPKWQKIDNFKVCLNQENILEVDDNSLFAFAQSFYSMQPEKDSFKIQILEVIVSGTIAIGFRKAHYVIPVCNEGSTGYYSVFNLWNDKNGQSIGAQWHIGDIIECRINTTNERNVLTKTSHIYLIINEQLVTEKLVEKPSEELFPTIFMSGAGNKIKYQQSHSYVFDK